MKTGPFGAEQRTDTRQMAITYSSETVDQDSLSALCQKLLSQRKVIVVSNRGPVEYHLGTEGEPRARRGSGGLVTALNLLCRYEGLTWISSAIGEGDRHVGAEVEWGPLKSPLPGHNLSTRFVSSSRKTYHKYYNIICNPLLWFLQHYMWNTPYAPNVDAAVQDAWDTGYVAMNRVFADAVISEAAGTEQPPVVMLQDYHLYLVGRFIRETLPGAILQHFTHIPWPNSSYWLLLPKSMRQAICEGLCAVDIVGFQTGRDVHNFLRACEVFLPGAKVEYGEQTVDCNGHTTRVRAYPASVNIQGLRRTASSPRVQDYEQRLLSHCGEKTIVRVDRAEPSKNIIRGFRAFDILLDRYPELKGTVKFLAFLVPTRTHIKQYQRYTEEITNVTERVNEKHGTPDWQPITIFHENNYTQAIAGMRLYDVLVVNAVIDGMNLVAKEGPIVNTKDGVLILSEGTGAHEQLGIGALSVAPADLEGTTEALYAALTMPSEERKRMAETLVRAIEAEDASHWLESQVKDICDLV
ncbi:MAG: trehalose-6-phosphate synthase [Dehalococcoidia bacterium]